MSIDTLGEMDTTDAGRVPGLGNVSIEELGESIEHGGSSAHTRRVMSMVKDNGADRAGWGVRVGNASLRRGV